MLHAAALALALVLAPAQDPTADELARARWIEGRVALPAGTPADEPVRVEAIGRAFEGGGHHAADVGVDGRFRVAVPERTRTLRLELRAPHLRLAGPVRLRVAELGPEIVLAPLLGGHLAGRIAVPVDDGQLVLDGFEPGATDSDPVAVFAETLAEDGSFSFGGLPLELEYRLRAKSGGRDLSVEGLSVVPGATVTLSMLGEEPPRIRGRVIDEQGRPLEGVRLLREVRDDLRTDADGRFERPARRAGGGWIRSSDGWLCAEGHQPLHWSFGTSELGLEATFVLRPALPLAGRVLHADGTPAAGWRVEALERERGEPPRPRSWPVLPKPVELGLHEGPDVPEPPLARAQATADAEGRFALDVASARPLRVVAWGARDGRREVAQILGVRAGGAPLELVLGPGTTVTGRVQDEDGAPLAGVPLRAARGEAASEAEVIDGTRSDADGVYRIEGLSSGLWRVEVLDPRLLVAEQGEAVVGSELPALALEPVVARRAAALSGCVVDAQGRGLVASLHAYPAHAMRFLGDLPDARGETAPDGVFELAGVPVGGVQVVVSAPGHAERLLTLQLEPGETHALGTLGLDPGVRVSGVAYERWGAPLAGAEVQLFGVEAVMGPEATCVTDAEGRFSFDCVAPGPHEVVPGGLLGDLALQRFVVGSEDLSLEVRHCDSSCVVTVEVEVRGPDGPLADGRVFLTPLEAIAPQANREGAGQVPGLYEVVCAPGDVWVTVLDENDVLLAREPRRVEQRETGGALQSMTVELPGGRVRLLARGADGPSWDDAWIEPADWMDALPFGPTGLAHGRAVFRHLPDGRYRVLAGSSAWAWDEPDPELSGTAVAEVEVRGGARATVRLELPPACGIEGVVRDEAGRAVPGARLWVWTEEGVPLDLYDLGSDASGRFVTWNLPSPVWVAAGSGLAASAPERLVLEPGRARPVEFTLRPATMLAVRLHDADGRPVRGDLRAVDDGGRAYRTLTQRRALSEMGELEGGTSFYDGFFLFLGPLPPGRWRVQAKTWDGRRAETALELGGGEERPLELTLR